MARDFFLGQQRVAASRNLDESCDFGHGADGLHNVAHPLSLEAFHTLYFQMHVSEVESEGSR